MQLDIFQISSYEPSWRDNRDAMEYPFLSLQKVRKTPMEYKRDGVNVSIAADIRSSIATIWDWDIIIFAASHLNQAIEDGRKPSPRIEFVPHDCLRQMGRGTGGRDYRDLASAIRRLRLTTVITNIRYEDGAGDEQPFSWLVNYKIPKRYAQSSMTPEDHNGSPDPARPWMIELPEWLYAAVLRQREILAVHQDYFQLTGGLERWLYRLARKSVNDKAEVPRATWFMTTLHERSGTSRPLRKFAFDLRKMVESQPLPEYGIRIDRDGKRETVTLYRDRSKIGRVPRGLKTAVMKELPPPIKKSG